MRQAWDHRENIPQYQQADTNGQLKARFFARSIDSKAAVRFLALTRSIVLLGIKLLMNWWRRSRETSERTGQRRRSIAFTRTA